MNLIKLSLKNLFFRPGRLFLTVVMISVGVALSSLSTSISTSVKTGLKKNIKDIDIVVGAKGSPAQLIFSSVYQLSEPGGNVDYNEIVALADNRLVNEVIEVYCGDSYHGSRIVGTSHRFLDLYDAHLAIGRLWNRTYEVVMGSQAAARQEAVVGDLIYVTHGTDGMGYTHEEFPFVVVGILKPTYSVMDKLVLTNLESMWEIHSTDHTALEADNLQKREVTAALVKLNQKNGKMSLLRTISQQTHLQGAVPVDELVDFEALLDMGNRIIQNIAAIFIALGIVSILIFMMSSVKAGSYEIALMRVMGATRTQVLCIILFEGLFIGIIVVVLGLVAAHTAMGAINPFLMVEFGSGMPFWQMDESEWVLIGLVLLFSILSTVIPAVLASRMNLSMLLTGKAE